MESVPSRFPSTTSPARSVLTGLKNERPPSGGSRGVEPIMMSPTAAIVTTPGGASGAVCFVFAFCATTGFGSVATAGVGAGADVLGLRAG